MSVIFCSPGWLKCWVKHHSFQVRNLMFKIIVWPFCVLEVIYYFFTWLIWQPFLMMNQHKSSQIIFQFLKCFTTPLQFPFCIKVVPFHQKAFFQRFISPIACSLISFNPSELHLIFVIKCMSLELKAKTRKKLTIWRMT